jgi:hypothetical protein
LVSQEESSMFRRPTIISGFSAHRRGSAVSRPQRMGGSPTVPTFDFAAAGFTGSNVMSAIQTNLNSIGLVILGLFGVGMALRWGPKITGSFRRAGR